MNGLNLENREGWELYPVPAYNGGVLSAVYATGYGIAMDVPEAGGKMQVVSETGVEEFSAYISLLENAGYKKTAYRTLGKNIYAQYSNGSELVYTYYIDCEKESRVILDLDSDPLNEFNYAYEAKNGDTASFYQYALMFDPTGKGGYNVEKGKIYENCGLFDVIKLSDNSLVLLDGGWFPQTPEKTVEECFK